MPAQRSVKLVPGCRQAPACRRAPGRLRRAPLSLSRPGSARRPRGGPRSPGDRPQRVRAGCRGGREPLREREPRRERAIPPPRAFPARPASGRRGERARAGRRGAAMVAARSCAPETPARPCGACTAAPRGPSRCWSWSSTAGKPRGGAPLGGAPSRHTKGSARRPASSSERGKRAGSGSVRRRGIALPAAVRTPLGAELPAAFRAAPRCVPPAGRASGR